MTPTTLLLRHAHPSFMDGDRITSQVFMPFPKDEGCLSVYDGDLIKPEDSYAHYTQTLGNQSSGLWALTKAETDRENVPASADPLPNFPSHSKIDFGKRLEKDCRKIAKRLKILAAQRGKLYSPIQ